MNNDDNSDVEYYKYHALTDLQGRGGDGPGTFNLYDILVCPITLCGVGDADVCGCNVYVGV